MEEAILFKLRFKDKVYIRRSEGTYNGIIRVIQDKIPDINFYIVYYICFNDYYQEQRQLTFDSINDFLNQKNKIIEVELNRSDDAIREIYKTFYQRKENKNIIKTYVSKLKKNYLQEIQKHLDSYRNYC